MVNSHQKKMLTRASTDSSFFYKNTFLCPKHLEIEGFFFTVSFCRSSFLFESFRSFFYDQASWLVRTEEKEKWASKPTAGVSDESLRCFGST